MNKSFEDIAKEARKLIKHLQGKCTEKTICENYGQKEIRKYKDKYYPVLSYREQMYVADILETVKDIQPL